MQSLLQRRVENYEYEYKKIKVKNTTKHISYVQTMLSTALPVLVLLKSERKTF